MLSVSILAVLFDILPVLLAAVLSALIWNFFFIPPLFTFHVGNTEDALMFLMYFVIAFVNAVLTFKIREAESIARDKEEKENSIHLYNTLLNSLSHEMRTPLATIIGAIDTLKAHTLNEELKNQLFEAIEISSFRLNRQVENLLNMNRLEAGMLQIKWDWFDINELIFSVIQKLTNNETHHQVQFTANENLPLFKGDAGLIENVLHNLVHNAIFYTPENSIIKIEARHVNDHLVITISDNGSGFPEDQIQHVFKKFYRLPNSKSGGTGLGLSIARGFIEAHHGHIQLENQKESGAKFTITLPAETTFITQLKNE